AAAYIAEQAQAGFPYWLLPAVAFLLAGIISFATGSSWGTFAIMMPLVIPTAVAIDAPLLVCIGAVLSGGLFGDHCSPISETTILSSTGAGCEQYEHFRTQL
ncbi:Na+/H+ antiporter NhaC family protein, partial [Escherichia coli]|nr:Na+/H+ antiporter NhaC family protein [Escherichia coli]